MKNATNHHTAPVLTIRKRLATRLREQTAEIEDALYVSTSALTEGVENEVDEPEYPLGRRAAIAELVDHAVTLLERPPSKPEPGFPLAAAVQVRRAARLGVSLGTVMRRYVAGERLFTKLVMEEAGELPTQELWDILSAQGPRFDNLLEVVVSEYTDELGRAEHLPRLRLQRWVEGLLAGDMAYAPNLGYHLDGWHLGVIMTGICADVSLRSLAANLSCNSLVIPKDNGVVWGWLGKPARLPANEVERVALASLPMDIRVAMGEPGKGVTGWQVTHREAMAGFHVMLRKPQKVVRGSKLMLQAAVLRDEGLADVLRQRYILPLGDPRDEGWVLQETLRAYFSTGGNAVTAAAVLDVNRQTVQRRLRKVEQRLGSHLPACQAELEVALALEQLDPR